MEYDLVVSSGTGLDVPLLQLAAISWLGSLRSSTARLLILLGLIALIRVILALSKAHKRVCGIDPPRAATAASFVGKIARWPVGKSASFIASDANRSQ
jgi:hypothetical protein